MRIWHLRKPLFQKGVHKDTQERMIVPTVGEGNSKCLCRLNCCGWAAAGCLLPAEGPCRMQATPGLAAAAAAFKLERKERF